MPYNRGTALPRWGRCSARRWADSWPGVCTRSRARSRRRRCTTASTTHRSRRWATRRSSPGAAAWRAESRSRAPRRSRWRSGGWCGAVAGATRPAYLSPPMLLAININNTETKVGLFRSDSLEAHWRLTTAPARTPDEWAAAFTAYLLQVGRSTQEVRAAVVASVVPPVTQGICEAVERATTIPPVIVDGMVVARSTASQMPCVTGGTTDATTAARTSWVDRPACSRYEVKAAAHSSGVRAGAVVSRQ